MFEKSWRRTTETSWRRSTETSLGVSFETCFRRRENVPLSRLGDVPLRRHWMFHLRPTCDVTGTYREISLRRRYDVLLPGGEWLPLKVMVPTIRNGFHKKECTGSYSLEEAIPFSGNHSLFLLVEAVHFNGNHCLKQPCLRFLWRLSKSKSLIMLILLSPISLRRSHWRSSMKKGAIESFAKLTGKNLCQSLFFNKVPGVMNTVLMQKRVQ